MKNNLNQFGFNNLMVDDMSPEKAGVGGSIPSLATMFSVVYRPSKTQFHSTSFQNSWPVEICLRWNEARLVSVSWGQDRISILPSFISVESVESP